MIHLKFLAGTSLAVVAGLSIVSAAVAGSEHGSNFPYDAPPEGNVGECFARVLVPAQYETVTEQVVVDEGGARIQVTAPQFAAQSQQYIVRDAGVRYEVRQPTYRTVTEQVMVRPAYETLQVVPGEYRTVTEQVQISEPHLAWKPGASLASRAGVRVTQTHQGEVYCLVEEPGETQNISKRVQVRAEQVRSVTVPPVYQNITRQVLVDAGGVREIPIPPQYGTLTIQQLVQPAGQVSTPIPQRMGTVSRRVQTSGESFHWVKVLCQTNSTPAAISEVQTLLHDQGYYQGPISGHVTTGTETAIAQYQQRMNIPHGGFLSLQTIDSLRGGYQPPAPIAQAVIQTPPATGYGYETVTAGQTGWTQAAPAQYAYQASGGSVQTRSSYGQSSGWHQVGSSSQSTSSYSGPVISGIPSGEVTTGIVPAVTSTSRVTASGGAQHWHTDRLLSWSGK